MKSRNRRIASFAIFAVAFLMVAGLTVLMTGDPAPSRHHIGVVDDWSFHRVVYSNPGTYEQAVAKGTYSKWIKVQYDNRYIMQQMKRTNTMRPVIDPPSTRTTSLVSPGTVSSNALAGLGSAALRTPPKKKGMNKDWSKALLAGQVQPNMYPATWASSGTTASCTNDFAVYPTGAAGSATAASVIAYNQLYVGGSGCSTVPSVYWAFDTNGGTISTSPVVSMDGTEVAFIQVSGTVASLGILKWKIESSSTVSAPTLLASTSQAASGCTTTVANPTITCTTASFNTAADQYAPITGTDIPSGATITLVNSATSINISINPTVHTTTGTATITAFNAGFVAPANYHTCATPCMTSLTLNGSPNDTFSSPFYDFSGTDQLYVGDDAGKLHKFSGVFSGTPAEVTTSWPVTLNATYKVTSPSYNPVDGYVYVGNTGGILYNVGTGNNSTTTGSIHGTSSDLGDTIQDAPLVDPSLNKVYAFVTTDAGNHNNVCQFATGFTSGAGTCTTGLGTGVAGYYLYDGTFDNVYYASSSPAGDLWVVGNTGAGSGGVTLYRIPIAGTGLMGTPSAAVSGITDTSATHYGWPSPTTEFCNGPCTTDGTKTTGTGSVDYLFFSVDRLQSSTGTTCGTSSTNGCVLGYTITTPTSPTRSGGLPTTTQATPGCWSTGGIVVDNAFSSAGASQIYFIGLNGNGAGGPTLGTYTSASCTGNIDTATINAVQTAQSNP